MLAVAEKSVSDVSSELAVSNGRCLMLKARSAASKPSRALRVWHRRIASRALFRRSCRKLGVDPGNRRSAPPAYGPEVIQSIIEGCAASGIRVDRTSVSLQELLKFVEAVDYRRHYAGYLCFYRHAILKKVLEQFVTLQTVSVGCDDVFMDVACEFSPFAEITSRVTGCTVFLQDLSFKPGVHGNRVGSRASSIPLGDATLTAIGLHCSFEHFEGNEDMGFIREAARLLKPGGKLFIVPVYIWNEPLNCFDPYLASEHGVPFDEKIIKLPLWNYGNRFIRYYSPETLKARVVETASPYFETRLMFVENYANIDPLGYVAFALEMVRR